MQQPPLRRLTEVQERRVAIENAIYAEYQELMSRPGQSATMATEYLAGKYGVSKASVYTYRKSAAARLAGAGRRMS